MEIEHSVMHVGVHELRSVRDLAPLQDPVGPHSACDAMSRAMNRTLRLTRIVRVAKLVRCGLAS